MTPTYRMGGDGVSAVEAHK